MQAPELAKIIETPLAVLHREAGARMGVWFGCALPDDFGGVARGEKAGPSALGPARVGPRVPSAALRAGGMTFEVSGAAEGQPESSWEREYWFARKSVALIDKNYRAYFSFTGPDRVRYLNAILTNNIKDLAPNHGTVSLLLNPQGHILAEIETYRVGQADANSSAGAEIPGASAEGGSKAHPDNPVARGELQGGAEAHPYTAPHMRADMDAYICVSYAMIRARLAETLEKFIIMDDVTLTDETDRWGTLGLEGPGATQLVQQLTGVDLNSLEELARTPAIVQRSPLQKAGATQSTGSGEPAAVRGGDAIPCVVTRRSPGEHAGAEFLVGREHLRALWALLEDETTKRGGGPIGYSALSALRLEQGIPWFGYDFGEKQIPHEAALETSHISYTKGCYTGQEIVERVRSRGQVNRRRVSLRFSGEAVPNAGEILTAGGKEVGYVTRAAYSPGLKTAIGMGYLRRENNAPGSTVEWKGGAAEVVAPTK